MFRFIKSLMSDLTSGDLVLDNNQFLIYNVDYPFARLTLSKDGDHYKVETTEGELAPEQLWTLIPDPNVPGSYYIASEKYPTCKMRDRRANSIDMQCDLEISQEPFHTEDTLFMIIQWNNLKVNKDSYFIYSHYYQNDRIAKYGRGNNEIGMYFGLPNKKFSEEWKLVPRFKANFYTNPVFHFDNLENPEKIIRKVSVTKGLRKSSTKSVGNKDNFKQSMGASLEAGCSFFKVNASLKEEFSNEFESTFSKTTEEEWSKTEEVTFTIPANKNFKVMQHVVKFDGKFMDDRCALLTDIKVFVSDKDEFDDPDKFIYPRPSKDPVKL